jgi:hypothetical protein
MLVVFAHVDILSHCSQFDKISLTNDCVSSFFCPKQQNNTVKMKSAVFAFTLVAVAAAQDLTALAKCGVSVPQIDV